jgi:starch phosphorylase
MYREASGTSGMTAAINGAINLSLPDGWVPEFAKDKENCFVIQPANDDNQEARNLMDTLENTVLPMYYDDHNQWLTILKNAANEVVPAFESARMVDEYYQIMYK